MSGCGHRPRTVVAVATALCAAAVLVTAGCSGGTEISDPCAALVDDSLALQREFAEQTDDIATKTGAELAEIQQRFLDRGAELARRQQESDCSSEEIERLMQEREAAP